MERELSAKIIRNTMFNALGRFWSIGIALALTPYVVGHLGVERYGIWALIGLVTGYFGLLDLGIGSSFVKYIAEHYARKDYGEINKVVNTGFVFYSVLALLIVGVAFLTVNPLVRLFKIPHELHSEAVFVFLLGISVFCVSSALSAFEAVQSALQRMDITNKVAIACSIPMVIGTILFLEGGYGLRGLMINNAIVLVLSGITNTIIAFRILPQLRFNPLLLERKTLGTLFKFGYKAWVCGKLESLFLFQVGKLLLSRFLGVASVTYYQLGSTIMSKARELPFILVSATVPAASELDAIQDKKRLYDLYSRGTKYIALAGIPLMSLVFVTAPMTMFAWMGSGYGQSVLVMQMLTPCYLINNLTGMGITIAFGIGRPELQMRAAILEMILNVSLSIILVIKIGFIGVLVATLVSLSLSSTWFVYMFHRHLGYPILGFFRKTVSKPLVTCLVLAAATGAINHYAGNLFLGDRWKTLYAFVFESLVFSICYVFVILRTGFLDEYDRGLLAKHIYFARFLVKTNR
ncbi:MAG: polysaccharide biosynthesis C-terminal domain-containing protein [Candidatus Eisenbacteria bacterium]|nr:polysaccharide biosynthesis C-terminal domain-containing protein [Candidatus Eisenbacteria bacterium]